jgi:hydrogenase nickel incorporation protein HypB
MVENEIITVREEEILDIEVNKDILAANRRLAEAAKKKLDDEGIIAIDIMGSVGSGKTSIIERLVEKLKGKYRIGMIAGDVATTIDADRVERHGVQAVQVNTGRECHLDANLVGKALEKFNLETIDLLFIENVGNLICPGDYPLGTHKRVVVISVTEGEYMVVKHPLIFKEADVAVINKIDLADVMGTSVEKLVKDAESINPNIEVIKTDAKNGVGLDDLIKALNL